MEGLLHLYYLHLKVCVKHSALVIRLKRESMCCPVLPYKRLLCLCGLSGDCTEVCDGFVYRAAPVHTKVYRGNVCVVHCCDEVARLANFKCAVFAFTETEFCGMMPEWCLHFFDNDFTFFYLLIISKYDQTANTDYFHYQLLCQNSP